MTFRVADARYALPAQSVREVVRRPKLTRVPHAPANLLGLANLRGIIVPLVSLASLTGGATALEGRVIVIDQADPVGLLVDEITAVTAASAGVAMLDLPALLATTFGSVSPTGRPIQHASVKRFVENAPAVAPVELLSFAVGGQIFALPIEQVDEVIRLPSDIALLPKADAVIVGSIARHGRLLGLLSLQVLLGLKRDEADGRPCVVIVRIGLHRVGLVVEAVDTILRVDERAIDPVPAVLSRGSGEARIQAICRLDDGKRLVSVLAADYLLRADLTSQLVQTGEGKEEDMTRVAEATEQFLVFQLGEQSFGLPIGVVSEVTMLPKRLARVPNAPDFIDGLMNLRGHAVPVIDQRRRFLGEAASGKQRRVVVVTLDDMRAGFVVDRVSEVLRVPVSALRAPPGLASEQNRAFDRVANLEHGALILIVEPRELLNRAEQDLLVAMTESGAATS